jgi:uncharacterized membrane protein SpoIIM required for sporulation
MIDSTAILFSLFLMAFVGFIIGFGVGYVIEKKETKKWKTLI